MTDAFQTGGTNDLGQDVEQFDQPDLSDEEMAEHAAGVFANAIQATRLFEVVEIQAALGQIHLMGRVQKDNEKNFVDRVVDPMLRTMQELNIDGFIGKQFLLKHNAVRYGWVVSMASSDIQTAVNRVAFAFEDAVPRQEVMEAPLLGGSTPQSGGTGTGRRGAHVVR